MDIHFYEEGKGVYAVRNLNDSDVPSKIFITVDDGRTWKNISPMSTPRGNAVGHCYFFNEQTGYFAVERAGFVMQRRLSSPLSFNVMKDPDMPYRKRE